MMAHHFGRTGCGVGLKWRTYASLSQWYVCNWCGGQIVHRFTRDRDYAYCADCRAENFIPQWLFDQQIAEGPGIVATLPAEIQELFKSVEPVSFERAVAEVFG